MLVAEIQSRCIVESRVSPQSVIGKPKATCQSYDQSYWQVDIIRDSEGIMAATMPALSSVANVTCMLDVKLAVVTG
jgi:hypothetical protein